MLMNVSQGEIRLHRRTTHLVAWIAAFIVSYKGLHLLLRGC